MIQLKNIRASLCIGIVAALTISTASAHGAWLAQRWAKLAIVIGEGWQENKYDPKQIYDFKAYTSDYTETKAKLIKEKDHASVKVEDDVAVVSFAADYGYWSNNPEGKWINAPMDKVSGSTIGTHALKYSVNYLKPVGTVKPVAGMPYQIVPLVDPATLKVGDTYQVQVLRNGKPLSDVDIIPNVTAHHDRTVKTDANGIATVSVENAGVNVVGIEMAFPFEHPDPKATREKVFASLSFTTTFEEAD